MPSQFNRLAGLLPTLLLGFLSVLACSDGGDDAGTDEDSETGGTPGAGGYASGGISGGGGTSTGGVSDQGGSGGLGAADATGGAGSGGDGSGGASGGAGSGGDDGSGGAPGSFVLTSTDLVDMGVFAEINTCAGNSGQMGFGEAISLEWSGYPAETMSFALTMIDVTLADGEDNYLGCHSAFWNLPVAITSLPSADWSSALTGAMTIRNGYLGPCPNFGGGSNEDSYVFTLYAMGEATLADADVNEQAFGSISSCNAFRQALEAAALDKVTLSGVSSAVGGN